jgi:hypothetical protein
MRIAGATPRLSFLSFGTIEICDWYSVTGTLSVKTGGRNSEARS